MEIAEKPRGQGAPQSHPRALLRNITWSLLASSSPWLIAIAAIPLLTRRLGLDRFAVLTLLWVAVGYLGLFDLGFGRALAKLASERLGSAKAGTVPALASTAFISAGISGALGGACVAPFIPWMTHRFLHLPPPVRADAAASFLVLLTSLPFTLITNSAGGLLESLQRFDLIARLRIPLAAFNYLEPLILALFTQRLALIALGLAVGRVLAAIGYVTLCAHALPGLRLIRGRSRFSATELVALARFGGWLTITNIVGPLMHYLDRFAVGAILPIREVAYYSVASDVTQRLGLVPSAIGAVFFPLFSATQANIAESAALFRRGTNYIFAAVLPMALTIAAFAAPGLKLWLGSGFSQGASSAMQILAFGVLVNAVAYLPYSWVQGSGRPDLTAKLHILELPLFITAFVILTLKLGLAGSAAAWVLRVSIDFVALTIISGRRVGRRATATTIAVVFATAPIFFAASKLETIGAKAAIIAMTLAAIGVLEWLIILDRDEKDLMRSKFTALRGGFHAVG